MKILIAIVIALLCIVVALHFSKKSVIKRRSARNLHRLRSFFLRLYEQRQKYLSKETYAAFEEYKTQVRKEEQHLIVFMHNLTNGYSMNPPAEIRNTDFYKEYLAPLFDRAMPMTEGELELMDGYIQELRYRTNKKILTRFIATLSPTKITQRMYRELQKLLSESKSLRRKKKELGIDQVTQEHEDFEGLSAELFKK